MRKKKREREYDYNGIKLAGRHGWAEAWLFIWHKMWFLCEQIGLLNWIVCQLRHLLNVLKLYREREREFWRWGPTKVSVATSQSEWGRLSSLCCVFEFVEMRGERRENWYSPQHVQESTNYSKVPYPNHL